MICIEWGREIPQKMKSVATLSSYFFTWRMSN